MNWRVIFGLFFLAACGHEPEKAVTVTQTTTTSADSPLVNSSQTVVDTSSSLAKDDQPEPAISTPVPEIKKPSGIYQFLLSAESTKILHTVAFYPTTYRLQEEYLNKKDSIVVTEGTWAPSQGYIWLYKDQLVRNRYTWKGDTLQYYSPRLKKNFSLTKLIPASNNKVWMDKKQQGVVLFAVGTEPFWSVEVNKRDSIILSMPDWTEPLRVKLSTKQKSGIGTVYKSTSDSLQVTVYPYFCSDGMSDFTYTNKITVQYRGKTYQGCGLKF